LHCNTPRPIDLLRGTFCLNRGNIEEDQSDDNPSIASD
jgi:hypothetical protein